VNEHAIKVAVHGAAGRMGRAIVSAIHEDTRFSIAALLNREASARFGRDGEELRDVDVVIDFSSPEATTAMARECVRSKTKMVIGTTGLDASANEAIDALARVAPVIVAPNTSVGVTVLLHLAAEAARLLGAEFDAEIVEMHHKKKVDAPSGTALAIASQVANAKGLGEHAFVHGRSGKVGARPTEQIGIVALRGGDVIGDHTLILAGPGERVELTHRAHDRSLFALGALRAARWLNACETPGRYDMRDVLGVG
jgi:4-hydroxy-tetrahydrodipicolinate reductase